MSANAIADRDVKCPPPVPALQGYELLRYLCR